MRSFIFLFLSFFLVGSIYSQNFSRKDSLRGNLTSLRTCYDVVFYDLFLNIDENSKSLVGSSNSIHFHAFFQYFQHSWNNPSILAEISFRNF